MPSHTSPSARSIVAAILAAASVLAADPGTAQAQRGWMPRLQLDNDVYNFWTRHTRRPDEEYTNGVQASLESLTAPWWGRTFAGSTPDCAESVEGQRCRATVVTLGQDLYTPNLDRAPFVVEDWEDERPYFAWLYLRGSARVSSARSVRTTSLSLGVTGPPAGGALAQQVAHRIGFNEKATGWETQIGFEPGAILELRQAVLAGRLGGTRGLAFDIAPEGAVSLGNVRTHAELGVTARLGWNLSHPWHPGTWRGRAPVEWWVSAGGRAEHVARDMSLDGTWRNPTRRVDRTAGVRQYEFAAGLRYEGVSLTYRAVTRSREYGTGPGHHTYSSMTVGLVPLR